MSDTSRAVGGGLLAFVLFMLLILGLSWIFQGNDFFLYRYFAPKRAEVERQVFENTKSYNQGTIQELRSQQLAYLKADEGGKDAMASVILHQLADFPDEKLDAGLRTFRGELQRRLLIGVKTKVVTVITVGDSVLETTSDP